MDKKINREMQNLMRYFIRHHEYERTIEGKKNYREDFNPTDEDRENCLKYFKKRIEKVLAEGHSVNDLDPPLIHSLLGLGRHCPGLSPHYPTYKEAMLFLLDKGADVNIRDENGCNALMYFAELNYYAHLSDLQELFKKQAEKDFEDPDGSEIGKTDGYDEETDGYER